VDIKGNIPRIKLKLYTQYILNSHLKNSVATSQKEVYELKPRIATVEIESKMIKNNLSLLAEENVRLTSEHKFITHQTVLFINSKVYILNCL